MEFQPGDRVRYINTSANGGCDELYGLIGTVLAAVDYEAALGNSVYVQFDNCVICWGVSTVELELFRRVTIAAPPPGPRRERKPREPTL